MFIFWGEEMCVGDLIEGESEMRAVERWGWGSLGSMLPCLLVWASLAGYINLALFILGEGCYSSVIYNAWQLLCGLRAWGRGDWSLFHRSSLLVLERGVQCPHLTNSPELSVCLQE